MSRTAAPFLLVLALPLPVAGVAPPDRPPDAKDQAEAQQFARMLLSLTQTIGEQYVRPVAQVELVEAALQGLFEAARQPVPAGLRKDLEQAEAGQDLLSYVALVRSRLATVSSVQGHRALLACAGALPRVLDVHCGIVPPTANSYRDERATELGIELESEPFVVGARGRASADGSEFGRRPLIPLRVSEVKHGGPAQRAGIRPGDVITHLNGKAITADTAASAHQELLVAEAGTGKEMTLTLRRHGRPTPVEVPVCKEAFLPESVFGFRRKRENVWDYWIDPAAKIAYVRIGFIHSNTPENLALVLAEIERAEGRGLILDLRWCPGGYIDPATAVAATFLKEGLIARVKYRANRNGGETNDYRAEEGGLTGFKAAPIPLVVLVNGETSGGGELIAAALQDHQRAVIAGQRTVGKGSVQSIISVPGLEGLSFKLTGGMLTRPNGKSIQRFPDSKTEDDWGIRPDPGRELPMTPDLSRHLKEQTVLYALRPGSSREALPLDDPEYDTQQQAAARLLREIVKKAEPVK